MADDRPTARRAARLLVAILVVAAAMLLAALPRPAAAQDLPVPTQTPAASRAKADQILAQPEYRKARPNLLQRAGNAISQWLGSLLQRLWSGGIGAGLAWLILVAGAVVVAALVVRLTRGVRAGPTRAMHQQAAEVRHSPLEWRTLAEGHEARGEWKQAVRCRYRALVAELVARRAVRDLPGRTTGEHRADLRAAVPEASAAFGGASELFERAWYGDRPTGPTETERLAALSDQVLAEVDGAAR